jgi:hypothetical protein
LDRICNEAPRRREHFNEIVNRILEKDPVGFAYDWKAQDLVLRAESPDSPLLRDAIRILQTALDAPNGRTQGRLRRYSRLLSCVGDIDGAIAALKDAAEVGYRRGRERPDGHVRNTQLLLDLSELYIRRGSAFFGAAIEELLSLPGEVAVPSRDYALVLLYAFIRDTSKCEQWLANWESSSREPTNSYPDYVRLMRAYSLLLQGHSQEAMELASNADAANWCELLICAGHAERVVAEAQMDATVEGQAERYPAHLVALAKYLLKDATMDESGVLKLWKDKSWTFRELLVVREYIVEKSVGYASKQLDIIEKLVRQYDLEFRLKGRRTLTPEWLAG